MLDRPWLTVSQAAAALGISERTVRRRANKGTLRARLEPTDSGPAWFIEPADVPDAAAKAAARVADTLVSVKAGETEPTAPDAADRLRTPADTRVADLSAALIASKDARIADLQKQLDATHNTLEREQAAHAETRRLLAFNLSSTALPTAQPVAPPQQPQRPPRRRARPLWAVLIGYRAKE